MLHAVIMAGGAGTRFWPASRQDRPKQLLNLAGERTMIGQTLDRLDKLVPSERVLVVTAARLVQPIRQQLPALPAEAIVGEPCKRDTAPCIGLAALLLTKNDPDATMAVMPADHVIPPAAGFQSAIRLAAKLVDQQPQRLVTFGIQPGYAAEIFGYIQRGDAVAGPQGDAEPPPIYQVLRFREKPDAATAQAYLASGEYYWNSGIFVWKARTILDALAQRQPQMLAHLEQIAASWNTPQQREVFDGEFAAIDGISIDYAVMEHARDVVVIQAPFAWDDVGGWQSLARLVGRDAEGNTIVGRHLGLETKNTIVRTSDDHLVVTLGMDDCIVVHTPDATLVANRNHEESIRRVVAELQDRGWDEFL